MYYSTTELCKYGDTVKAQGRAPNRSRSRGMRIPATPAPASHFNQRISDLPPASSVFYRLDVCLDAGQFRFHSLEFCLDAG